ncbi:LPXTG cell wall anchor domain-containing protein [Gordonibacter sp. Marseille-P4307]|uniref:LPXTG cell wall anchor domain-containing protein n=1 Tax=Gordonibacter sp. Marseille-P4307 TaxID=2161815 RepID=UPI000F53D116
MCFRNAHARTVLVAYEILNSSAPADSAARVVPTTDKAQADTAVKASFPAKLPITGDAFVIAAVVAGLALVSSGTLAFALRKRRAAK